MTCPKCGNTYAGTDEAGTDVWASTEIIYVEMRPCYRRLLSSGPDGAVVEDAEYDFADDSGLLDHWLCLKCEGTWPVEPGSVADWQPVR